MRPHSVGGGLVNRIKSFSRAVVIATGLAGALGGVGGCALQYPVRDVPIFGDFLDNQFEHRNYDALGYGKLKTKDGSENIGWWRFNKQTDSYEDVFKKDFAYQNVLPAQAINKDQFSSFRKLSEKTSVLSQANVDYPESTNSPNQPVFSSSTSSPQLDLPPFFFCKFWRDFNHDGFNSKEEVYGRSNRFFSYEPISAWARIRGKSGSTASLAIKNIDTNQEEEHPKKLNIPSDDAYIQFDLRNKKLNEIFSTGINFVVSLYVDETEITSQPLHIDQREFLESLTNR